MEHQFAVEQRVLSRNRYRCQCQYPWLAVGLERHRLLWRRTSLVVLLTKKYEKIVIKTIEILSCRIEVGKRHLRQLRADL